ncbi:MAG: hypothetical protein LC792_09640, partial [Actinobacteria bacterium]|nr:hypothetical protein [Actinomycetota bacterium]
MRRILARFPLRGLSLAVFAVLLVGSLTASAYARRVMADQERRMLDQRATESAALLTNVMTQSQTSTRSLAAVVLATHADPTVFGETARRDQMLASGGAVALVEAADGRDRVVVAEGTGLAAGQELSGEAAAAVERARGTDKYVSTRVYTGPGAAGERRIGGALRVDAEPGSPVIYRESVLRPPGVRRQLTSTQPFSEIEAALYAGSVADPGQIVLATRPLPIPGHTVDHVVDVGDD